MSPLRAVLCAALALGLVLGPGSAEARFGKRSNSSDSKKDDDKGHEATAVGEDSDDDRHDDDRPRRRHRNTSHFTDVDATVGFFAFIFSGGNHRLMIDDRRGPDAEWRGERHAAPLSFRLGLQGGPVTEGAAVDLFIGLEGRRFGADVRLTGMGLDADDGSDETDTISLVEAHLTWAIVSLPQARVRVEAGVSTAHAPDVTFVGPSLGMSLEACMAGPLDFEARVQTTPFPYRQVDASAALALHLGALVLRGGYRGMVLDDAGEVDDVRHVDTFHGPFFGLGLTY
ncbi:hypothetical protein JY651_44465 [Pyxidicoccus parkwayensis]|uniref:Outer membrane protein beta-barrel domain-containing protein n=1 Tax=Pyxidicoccus parkwayensis TaxID=2813578 RepID=A0ABX7NUS1_9BACT|nr:hypothetical protein [Pyxidicoccus parkwaysis]QSQ22119.1 hypothetical protein JY651_44465 [Pyxidicoccus parkwaysis]